jgi:transposase-like protein
MSEEAKRTFSREYKVAAVRRMLAGENVSALARELGVRRKYLYQWRERFRLGGAIALRSRGRPTKAEVLAMQAPGGDEAAAGADPMPPSAPPDELAKAQRRIAELERKVGQQQIDLDFFRQALRHVREQRQRSGAPSP